MSQLERCRAAIGAYAWLVGLWLSATSALASPPQRVVSLSPELTEIVFALGAGDRVVGVTAQCDEPAAARQVDRVGTFLTPNVELVLAKQPDLILVSPSPGNRRAVEALREMGPAVLVIEARSISETRSAILAVGEALETQEAAGRLLRSFDERLTATTERLRDAAAVPVAFIVGRNPLILAGAGTLQDELIRLAGGKNLGAQVGQGWPRVDLEFLLAQVPQVIVDASMGSESGAGDAFWQRFPEVPAVRAGRVYAAADSRLLRAGPRLPEALELLARWFHPERFAPLASCREAGP